MARRTLCRIFLMMSFIPVLGAPARANSITTYGVVVTALGNDLQLQYVDQAQAEAAVAGDGAVPTIGGLPIAPAPSGTPISGATVPNTNTAAANATADSGLLITPNGSGGITVMPFAGPTLSTLPPVVPSGVSQAGTSLAPIGSSTSPTALNPPLPPTVSPPQPLTVISSTPIPVAATAVAANTPEPASITLLALAGFGSLYARRRRTR